MKRNVSFRLRLNRETLRTLVSPELEGAQGGIVTNTAQTVATCNRISCGGTCGALTCGVVCGPSVVCPYTTLC
ncbi:MAG TPA: hypothetical protein VIE43_13960 [Thermoanaerobaculia bacterium]|jgi:hypothetical protein|nr:hypothetical protein [Thermoanaerobaculia bacterium]